MAVSNLYLVRHESNTGLSDVIDNFLDYKRRSLSKNSTRAYIQNLNYLKEHCKSLTDINRQHLNTILNQSGSVRTKALRKAVIDNFIEWCVKEEILAKKIETEIYTTRMEKHQHSILTISENELRVLLAGVDDGHIRDVLLVGFYMGLRISELVHCRPAWIVKDGLFLRIGDLRIWELADEFHPKSQKEHDDPIAIPPQVRRVFDRNTGLPQYSRMFGYSSESTLRLHLKNTFQALPAPLCNHFTAHHLRHSCISYWLNEKRVSVQEVQRMARHSRMDTTMRYHHPSDDAHLAAFSC